MNTLDFLQVVLVGTRFPENIGMAARACANMGVSRLSLVAPEWWDLEKARPLATAQGEALLHQITVFPDLASAVADSALVIGTTARTGGWRQEILRPAQAARETLAVLRRSAPVSIVFGPEDRGLNNEDIQQCQRLVCIPTSDAASLNVAQAVLLLLYECRTAALEQPQGTAKKERSTRFATQECMEFRLVIQ